MPILDEFTFISWGPHSLLQTEQVAISYFSHILDNVPHPPLWAGGGVGKGYLFGLEWGTYDYVMFCSAWHLRYAEEGYGLCIG